MNLRDKLSVFVLTKEEQRAVAFVILALVLGLLTKHYRATHSPAALPPNDAPALSAQGSASPIPGMRP